ncbi:MAG: hypothetical protein HQL74_14335 [Magnetococcales bacterium]|nr:hypothetical protein [Magnetococcales bacterium]
MDGQNRQGIDAETVRNSAHGQWREIHSALGLEARFLSNKHGPCPFCGGIDRFRYDDKDGSGSFFCPQCGPGDGLSLAAKLMGLDPKKDFPKVLKAVAEIRGIATESRPPSIVKKFFNPQLPPGVTPRSEDDTPEIPGWMREGPPPEDYDDMGQIDDAVPVLPRVEPSNPVEQTDRAALAVRNAGLVLAEAKPAQDGNSYLTRKGVLATDTLGEIGLEKLKTIIGSHPKGKDGPIQGVRVLVASIYVGDKLSSLQFIDENGGKAFLLGGGIKGGYWTTQALPKSDMQGLHFLVGEGVATVLSGAMAVPEAIGVAALMNSNLPAIARILRDRYPTARITILADLEKAHG